MNDINNGNCCDRYFNPNFLHADSEDSDQTGRMPRLIWVFAGRTLILLVLSFRGLDLNLLSTVHLELWNRNLEWFSCFNISKYTTPDKDSMQTVHYSEISKNISKCFQSLLTKSLLYLLTTCILTAVETRLFLLVLISKYCHFPCQSSCLTWYKWISKLPMFDVILKLTIFSKIHILRTDTACKESKGILMYCGKIGQQKSFFNLKLCP